MVEPKIKMGLGEKWRRQERKNREDMFHKTDVTKGRRRDRPKVIDQRQKERKRKGKQERKKEGVE